MQSHSLEKLASIGCITLSPLRRKRNIVSEKGSSLTGVPIPANAKPFAERTWLQLRMPQCPMYEVAGKTDYATLGTARERIDPTHSGIKLMCR